MKQRGGRPAVLSLDRILAAAVEVVDEEGADALTMRRLGAQLGVAPMSLYRHVPNRDALLDEVVNRLFAETELGPPRATWAATLAAFAAAYRRMLLSHPRAVPLVATHPVDAELGLRLLAPLVEQFGAAGIGQRDATTAIQSVGVFVLGHALAQVPDSGPYYDEWFETGLAAMITGFTSRLGS